MLRLRWCRVVLDMQDIRTERRYLAPVWAVSVAEHGTVPDGEEGISWLLLTTYEVRSFDDAALGPRAAGRADPLPDAQPRHGAAHDPRMGRASCSYRRRE